MTAVSRQSLPAMLTEAETADLLGCSTRTLQAWRQSGQGPDFVKLNGTMVRYRRHSVEDFIAAGARRPTTEGGQ
jgi:predicted DNA-binding transcriptional regulator AlpA